MFAVTSERVVRPFCVDDISQGLPPTKRQSKKLAKRTHVQSVAESVSSGVWDDKYIEEYGQLKYATALLQGNRYRQKFILVSDCSEKSLVLFSPQAPSGTCLCREDMQDFLDVVPKARCGFLCAGNFRLQL